LITKIMNLSRSPQLSPPVGGMRTIFFPLSVLLFSLNFTAPVFAFQTFVSAPSLFSRRVPKTPPLGAARAPQVLEFREPRTNVTVMLIGAMVRDGPNVYA